MNTASKASRRNLDALIRDLKATEFPKRLSEESTIQKLILPLLTELGWRSDKPKELHRSVSLGQGQIDFVLVASRRRPILLEAKRLSEDLEPHVRQLLLYAFELATPMAVLTNGVQWWLYLPMAEGYWRERRFAEIDLRELSTREAASMLRMFLSRSRWQSNAAIRSARKSLEERQKAEMFAKTHPIVRLIEPGAGQERLAYQPASGATTKIQLAFDLLRERWATKDDLEALTGQRGGWQLYNYNNYVKSGRYGKLLLLHKPSYRPEPMRLASLAEAKRLMKDPEVAIYRPRHRKKGKKQSP